MPTSEIKFSRRVVPRINVRSLTIDVLFSKRNQNKTHFKAGTFDLFKEIYCFVKERGRDKTDFIIISFPKIQRNLNHSIR